MVFPSLRVHCGGPGGEAHRGGEAEVGRVEESAWGLQPSAADPLPFLHLPLSGDRCQRAGPQWPQPALRSPQHTTSWWVTHSNVITFFKSSLLWLHECEATAPWQYTAQPTNSPADKSYLTCCLHFSADQTYLNMFLLAFETHEQSQASKLPSFMFSLCVNILI